MKPPKLPSLLERWDLRMTAVAAFRKVGEEAIKAANQLERDTEREFGIEHFNREPGFPCWRIEGSNQWFDTPLQAVEHKSKVVSP